MGNGSGDDQKFDGSSSKDVVARERSAKYFAKRRKLKSEGRLERLKGYEDALTDMLPEILEQQRNLSTALTRITEAVAQGNASKEDLKILNNLLKNQQYWLDRVDPVTKKVEVDAKHTSVDVAALVRQHSEDVIDAEIVGDYDEDE